MHSGDPVDGQVRTGPIAEPLPSVSMAGPARAQLAPADGLTRGAIAYAAPIAGGYFFYIPMWSILPGIYAEYFGLSLTVIAAVVLFIRLFDGFIDTMVGYLSDLHRSRGGSRKTWVTVGSLGTIVACYFLFQPPRPATTTYYLLCSMAYFLFFTISEIPHLTWGNELTLDYHRRAKVFSVRFMLSRAGIISFYALPLLPFYTSTAYTPEVLQDAVIIGATMTVAGLAWMLWTAPAGIVVKTIREDSWRLLRDSLLGNKALLTYLAAYGCMGLAGGMWYGLIYFYLGSYLGLGEKVAIIFLLATVIGTVSTPWWLKLIGRTSKSAVWAIGVTLFVVQLIGVLLLGPGAPWWIAFALVIVANLFFTCNDVAAMSILGDIVDYGKLKFRKDRGATYFGFKLLIFKMGLGVGGALALGTAGVLGFDPSSPTHSSDAVLGLKVGFAVLPMICALIGLIFILLTPINPKRHRIIQRRIESRVVKGH
jgi:glycoside/pentoside/hexuronide:cation symporter, GPH family